MDNLWSYVSYEFAIDIFMLHVCFIPVLNLNLKMWIGFHKVKRFIRALYFLSSFPLLS